MSRAWVEFLVRYTITAAAGALVIAGVVRLRTSGTLDRLPGYDSVAIRAARLLEWMEPAAAAGGGPEPCEAYVRRTQPRPPDAAPAAAAVPAADAPARPVGNPYEAEYRKAAQAYEAFWKTVRALEAEHAGAEGARRMELADELRLLKGPDITVRKEYEDARERYQAWEKQHAAGDPGAPTP
jgi:hypothetical protein